MKASMPIDVKENTMWVRLRSLATRRQADQSSSSLFASRLLADPEKTIHHSYLEPMTEAQSHEVPELPRFQRFQRQPHPIRRFRRYDASRNDRLIGSSHLHLKCTHEGRYQTSQLCQGKALTDAASWTVQKRHQIVVARRSACLIRATCLRVDPTLGLEDSRLTSPEVRRAVDRPG